MGRETELSELASKHRSPAARRAAVALAALLDASRRYPGVPGPEAIAKGIVSLEEAAISLAQAGGPWLPGFGAEDGLAQRLRGRRQVHSEVGGLGGRDEGVVTRGSASRRVRPSVAQRISGALGKQRVRRIGATPRRGAAQSAWAALAAEMVELDWTRVADPAGRVLQEFRAAADRKRHGAFYTPPYVVSQLVEALPVQLAGARVLDPACGSGEFLLEASRKKAIVSGADVDAEAVAVARFRLGCADGVVDELVSVNLLDPGMRLAGPYDAVVGNPPYVRFHNLLPASRTELARRFETAQGQFDLFAPFLEAALARVRPSGAVAFVLPALVLRGARYAALRRFLLGRARVHAVIDHGDGAFEGVLAPTCVIVLVRLPSRPGPRPVTPVRWTAPSGAEVSVDEEAWRRDPQSTFAPVSAAATSILARLEEFPRLAQLAELGRGAEIGRSHPALHAAPGGDRVPCLTGSDVEPWRATSMRWLDPSRLAKRLFPEERRARVLVRETGAQLTAVAVEEGTASTRSLFHVVPNDPAALPLDFLLAWLHSAIAQWWFSTCVRADSGIFPKVRIGQLGSLRVPDSPAIVEAVSELARRRRAARTPEEAADLDRWIDEAFATHLRLTPEERLLVAAAR